MAVSPDGGPPRGAQRAVGEPPAGVHGALSRSLRHDRDAPLPTPAGGTPAIPVASPLPTSPRGGPAPLGSVVIRGGYAFLADLGRVVAGEDEAAFLRMERAQFL